MTNLPDPALSGTDDQQQLTTAVSTPTTVSQVGIPQKESEPAPKPETGQKESQLTDIELAPELEAAGVEKLSETIELPPDIAGMGVQTVGPSQPVTTTQTTSLPLTDDQIVQGLHVKIALSLRWLAQWCIRQLKVVHIHLKKAHGKIVRVSK